MYGLTTYNRIDYLKNHIESCDKTRDKSHDWIFIIEDDDEIKTTNRKPLKRLQMVIYLPLTPRLIEVLMKR